MIHVRQRTPGYISGVDWEETSVATLPELLALPWVERWRKQPGFVRFSLSKRPTDYLLMAELTNEFWVVAFLSEPLDLPAWVAP